jgi:hypothetical protein
MRMTLSDKKIEIRKPWRRIDQRRQKPLTFFDSYHSRLYALAYRHGVPPASLKGLLEDAFGRPDAPPVEPQADIALKKLAKMNVGPCELNWLFQYHIVPEGIDDRLG